MKKNGFTLTELLAVIVIMGLLVGIAIPVYFAVQRNIKENEYQSRKKYIENMAVSYASENNVINNLVFTPTRLVTSGYLTADDYVEENGTSIPFIRNPKNENDNLSCHVITITQDNYDYYATMSDEDGDCSLVTLNAMLEEIGVKAFNYENSKVGDQIELEGSDSNNLNWTNKDVLVYVKPSNKITISLNGHSTEVDENNVLSTVNSNDTIDKEYSNVIIVKADVILRQSIVFYIKDDSSIRTTTMEVKIDKESPTSNSEVYDGFSANSKDAIVYVSDGNGSGAKGAYMSSSSTFDGQYFMTANKDGAVYVTTPSGLKNGTYYIWAMDIAGNIASNSSELVIKNVDENGGVGAFTVSSKKSGYNSREAKISIKGSDTGIGADQACILYDVNKNVNNCTWKKLVNNEYSEDHTFPGAEGSGTTYKVYGYIKDGVGNISSRIETSYKLYTKCSQTKAGPNKAATIYEGTYVATGTSGLEVCTSTASPTGETLASKYDATLDSYKIPKNKCDGTPTKKTTCWIEHGGECCHWIWDGGCNETGGQCAPEQVCTSSFSCPEKEVCGEGWVCSKDGYSPNSDHSKCCKKVTKCESGYTKNKDGTKCEKYTCPNGGRLNGKKCEIYTATCPAGYAYNGSTCVQYYNCCTGYKVNRGSYCESYTYTCPNGGTTAFSKYCFKADNVCSSSCSATYQQDLYSKCNNASNAIQNAINSYCNDYDNKNTTICQNYRYESYRYDMECEKSLYRSVTNQSSDLDYVSSYVVPYRDSSTNTYKCILKGTDKPSNSNYNNDYYGSCSTWEEQMGYCSRGGSNKVNIKVISGFTYKNGSCVYSLCSSPNKVLSRYYGPSFSPYQATCVNGTCTTTVDKFLD